MTRNQKIILAASSLLVIVIGVFTYDYFKIKAAYDTPLPPEEATTANDSIDVDTTIIETPDELDDNLPHGNTSLSEDTDDTTDSSTLPLTDISNDLPQF